VGDEDKGKPLVVIWGLGFPDRGYNIQNIGIDKVISFLKNDPQYGGCTMMLGVPTYFRDLIMDTNPDPFLHEQIASADIAWCAAKHVHYTPCVCPGFSWNNMHKNGCPPIPPLNQIPRQKGVFYWSQISGALNAKAQMLYVTMSDEMDERTAIMKCDNHLPAGVQLCDYEGMPTDHYLWLTGQAAKMLRGEIALSWQMPTR